MSDETTITIKKDALWKYAFFILLAISVISFFVFANKSGNNYNTGNAVNTGNANAGGNGNAAANAGTTTGAATGPADLSSITKNPALFPALGPENAQTTVVEFVDFQCPYCGIASGLVPWIDQVKTQYSDLAGVTQKIKDLAQQGKVRFSVVTMSFLGQESVYAAQAGLCANQQGKFFEMEDAIYGAQTQGENTGKFNKDKLEIIAGKVTGLDQTKFKDCLDNDKTLSDVQKVTSTASQFAQGTPTFYVNGKQVQASWSAIQSAIGA